MSRKRAHDDTSAEPTSISDYKPGAIVKVVCHNFVTYHDVTFTPGPNLNMIIGPNGSGKSTLVCAICLGLGGRPSLLNRAKDIRDFVKSGCDSGWVEIHLKTNRGVDTFRRELKKEDNSSTWKLNGRAVTEKQIHEHVQALNVQVESLIQFLPQEKVGDFALMTPKEVLIETEKAVEDSHLYQQHMALIQYHGEEQEAHRKLQALTSDLDALQRRNAGIEPIVARYREHLRVLEELRVLEIKLPWVRYQDAREAYIALKEQRKVKQENVLRIEAENEPHHRRVAELEKQIDARKATRRHHHEQYQAVLKKIEKQLHTISKEDPATDEVRTQLEQLDKNEANLKKRIATLRDEIISMTSDLSKRRHVDITEQLAQSRGFMDTYTSVSALRDDFKPELGALQARENELKRQLQRLSQDSNESNGLHQQRLRAMQEANRDAFQAYQWVKANERAFKSPVFEPIVLSVGISNAAFAGEIEGAIPKWLLTAFIFSTDEDLNTFISAMKSQRISCPSVTIPQMKNYGISVARNELATYGFDGYLIDYVVGPEEVKMLLCDIVRLHQIPVTKKAVNHDQVKALASRGIHQYAAAETSYRFLRSRYTSGVGISTEPVKPARLFSRNVDTARMQRIQEEVEGKQRELQDIERRLQEVHRRTGELDHKLAALKEQRDEVDGEIRKAREANKAIDALQARLKLRQQQLSDSVREAEKADVAARAEQLRKKLKAAVQRRIELNSGMLEMYRELSTAFTERAAATLAAKQLEADVEEARLTHARVSEALDQARKELQQVTADAEEANRHARSLLTAVQAHGTPSEELQAKLAELPNTEAELQGLITSARANLDVTRTHDGEHAMREYEERKREIEKSAHIVANGQKEHDKLVHAIKELKDKWLPKLQVLISRINEAFGELMRELEFVGEIHLNEDPDYSKWAISILVKFREAEKLSVLAAHHQSGGERSVCTILYLMALQNMARSPFRVVDEINQGMDSINERRVHRIMVERASAPGTPQYFLITPKLLTGLEYNPRMKVLCVFTGKHLPQTAEWNVEKFIARKRSRVDTRA